MVALRVGQCALRRLLAGAAALQMCIHAGAAFAQVEPKRPAAAETPGSRTCAKECHQDLFSHKVLHGPVQSDCAACHVQTGDVKDHKFGYIVPIEQLCVRCHTLPHENGMHAPVQDGKCMECHDPHGSDRVRMLVADPRKDLCLKCHKQVTTKAKFVHGPVAVGACIVCHKPHSSTKPKLLVEDGQALCLTCHAEIQPKASDGMHMHGAMDQGCTTCHDPHASEHKFQLKQSAPNLCMTCHKDRFDQITSGATVIHGAVTAEGGCSVCHEPHASRLASLQRGTQPGTCLSCHDKPLKTADGTPLVNMSALLAANPDRHGPIREGVCTACHDPHAGNKFRLLAEEYPPQFYAPFSIDTFKLCFKCHIPDLVLKPSGQGLTQFRNGDKNLHWLHVNQEKGRTCRACHEVHASKRPSHIREAVPFGNSGWLLDINFEKNVDGGQCSPGCHAMRTYNRSGLMPALNTGPSGTKP